MGKISTTREPAQTTSEPDTRRILQKIAMLNELCPGAAKDIETMIDAGSRVDAIRHRLKREEYRVLLSDVEIESYVAWLPLLRGAGRRQIVLGGMQDYFAVRLRERGRRE